MANGGDGSEVICNHAASTGGKRIFSDETLESSSSTDSSEQSIAHSDQIKKRRMSFPTADQFTDMVKAAKPNKWTSLPLEKVFHVRNVEEVPLEDDGENGSARVARFAELEDSDGELVKVWLPGILSKKLARINVHTVDTFVRSLGPKVSEKTKWTYQNFEIVNVDERKSSSRGRKF